jgi:phosphatidylserine/phosphatidylglycerophosphate/cardiolipin synthase-like enzyme
MKILFDRRIYTEFTEVYPRRAQDFIWIATANIKATALRYDNRFISFVDLIAILAAKGVAFRIIHSELPSAPFRERYDELDERGILSANVEFLYCVRLHTKMFLIDGDAALLGSPNLTGAGMGAKSANKRNFEIGFLFEGKTEVRPFMNYFDNIWMGAKCPDCKRKDHCPAPVC